MPVSPFVKGDTVRLAKDWGGVAKAGELQGVVDGFYKDGRAIVKPEAGVSFVAPNDGFWLKVHRTEPQHSGSLF